MNEAGFRKLAEEKGYGEVDQGDVAPGYDEEMHTHDYSVLSLILGGEFTLTTPEETTVLKAGDWCEIPVHSLHKEQTGAEPGGYRVARK